MKVKKEIKRKKMLGGAIMFGVILIVGYFSVTLIAHAQKKLASSTVSTNSQITSNDTATSTTAITEKVFGLSETGRSITGYIAGSGSHTIMLFAAIHGNEMGTTVLLNQLVTEIKNNPSLVAKDNRVIIIPIANPDGYYDRTDKFNANGVNLNLNFATSDWQEYGPEGTYAGSKPFSEKESQVIAQVVKDYNPDYMISYHSYGALVTPENYHSPSQALAKWYSDKSGYTYFDDDSWNYPGTATKWFVETTNKAAVTVELSNNSDSDWGINKEAILELIGSVHNWN